MRHLGTLFMFAVIACAQVGCSSTPKTTLTDDQIRALAFSRERSLRWQQYDGRGNPARAVYLLGSHELGQGEVGLRNFERIVEQAPRRSRFVIGEFYSPFEKPPRTYPMDNHPVWQRIFATAREREVTIDYPTLLTRP